MVGSPCQLDCEKMRTGKLVDFRSDKNNERKRLDRSSGKQSGQFNVSIFDRLAEIRL